MKLELNERSKLIDAFSVLKTRIKEENLKIKDHVTSDHFILFQCILNTHFDKITDKGLIMLAGAFDFTMIPGIYPYSKQLISQLNEVGSVITSI